MTKLARAKLMLEIRRANCWLCHKMKEDFVWNLAKLEEFVSLHERLTLKLDKVQDIKCKLHSYRTQIQELVLTLPERFNDSKVSIIYDSAPNRCR